MKINIQNDTYDFFITLLKTATYGVAGTVATAVVQVLNQGLNIKEALVYGVAVGVVAGMKNVSKHYFGVDLDLSRMRK